VPGSDAVVVLERFTDGRHDPFAPNGERASSEVARLPEVDAASNRRAPNVAGTIDSDAHAVALTARAAS
jgi:hypothetical protein